MEPKEIRPWFLSLPLPVPRFGNMESRNTAALELSDADFQDDRNTFFIHQIPGIVSTADSSRVRADASLLIV